MTKVRIYEIAKKLNIDNKVVVQKAKDLGMDIKNHMSSVAEESAKQIEQALSPKKKAAPKIKIYASSLRKKHKSEQPENNKKDNRGNRNRNNNRQKPQQNSEKSKPANKPAARDLLKQLQTKQRAEAEVLDKQAANAKKQYHEDLNKKEPEKAKERTIGPKIIKPSPKREEAKQEATKPVITPEAPRPAPSKGRDKGKPGRKGKKNFEHSHNDSQSRRKKNNKKRQKQDQAVAKKPVTQRKEKPLPEVLVFEPGMNAQDLGKLLHREPAEIVKKLFMLGVMTNQNQSLDKDTIELIAAEYGIESQEKVHEDLSDIDTVYEKLLDEAKNAKTQTSRPPVVTIMGHVDHGKTTLLDRLRHTNVTAKEAGGITQKIGAYQVRIDDRPITFLDTPGHAAFSNMRARGAEVTDIVVLIVAADDGVMPQTIEAIDHAKSAGVPIIVAINKMDAPGANPQHVTEQLMKYNLIPEDYGGDTIYVQISAKTGENVEELLQMILLQADVMELKANAAQKAIATVVEARLSRGRGPVADLLIQQGTLHVGDPIVVGNTFGRVRVMTNDRGRQIKKATPGMPVEITGLNDVPESADKLVVFDDEKTARSVGESRAQIALQKSRENTTHITLDNLFDTMKQGDMKEVAIVIKADVQGSVEALQQSLEKIDVEGVRCNIIHGGVGAINESDVTLASASNALIIGFNVRPTATARSQAEQEGLDIKLYSVIYKAIDDVTSAMKGMLEPTYEEKVIGNLTVRDTWKLSKVGTIAGAFVDNGYITRESGVRLIRDGVVIYDGEIGSLKRFKDDVKEVKAGFDCGLTIEGYNDIKVDDEIEVYEMQEVPTE
ncbi:MAG: translation initiation factor IF-2 [Lactobacillus sp.]|nr:translation initiation factor IF-2 [Lactobacillus sp.]